MMRGRKHKVRFVRRGRRRGKAQPAWKLVAAENKKRLAQ